MIQGLGIALTGLDSASKKLYASASNIANVETVGSLDGSGRQAYSAVETSTKPNGQGGVQTEIVPRQVPFVPSFAPGSPFANEDGLVNAPNVNVTEEVVNSAIAEYSFKSNALMIEKINEMQDTLLEAFDEEV